MAYDLNVGMNQWDKADFSRHTTIYTHNLRSCVACVSSNGVIAHLNPDWQGETIIINFIEWLKKNSNPANTEIALIGGVDDKGQTYKYFKSSEELTTFLSNALEDAGFKIVFRDLYGDHQRSVVLNKAGQIDITDKLDSKYHQTYTFTTVERPDTWGKLLNRLRTERPRGI